MSWIAFVLNSKCLKSRVICVVLKKWKSKCLKSNCLRSKCLGSKMFKEQSVSSKCLNSKSQREFVRDPNVAQSFSPTNILEGKISNSDFIDIMTSSSLHGAPPIFFCRRPACYETYRGGRECAFSLFDLDSLSKSYIMPFSHWKCTEFAKYQDLWGDYYKVSIFLQPVDLPKKYERLHGPL